FDAGGVGEWLLHGQNGFLAPRMNRAQFASSIETLLRDKTLARQMGARGRQLVSEKYNFERYISGLEKMLAQVVAEEQARQVSSKGAGTARPRSLHVKKLSRGNEPSPPLC
ncbi:MAG TPA: hypothetical protein VH598_00005, partial [Verrucomicrobiae bacterium]|nr:hypothetical protein [Verrucomicrobiae bacterium]